MPDRVPCPWCRTTYRKGDENREYVCVLCCNRPLPKELLAAYLLLGDELAAIEAGFRLLKAEW